MSESYSDIIVIPGARLREIPGELFYEFPFHIDTDKEWMPIGENGKPQEIVGGDSRLAAAAELNRKSYKDADKHPLFLSLGNYETLPNPDGTSRRVSRPESMRDKLVGFYGIPASCAGAYHSKPSTYGNADAFFEWINEFQEKMVGIREVKVLTNEFHITRTFVMFAHALYARTHDGTDLANIMPERTKRHIEAILSETLPDEDTGDARELAAVRQMYEPFLEDAPLRIVPIVVEDILVMSGNSELSDWANEIRNDVLIHRVRKHERQGISAFLSGAYDHRFPDPEH
ncbi:MAG: DUF218 domain-containing protein [Candidatus Moranbacteria bacterium]|nr:DUF218 domain-containing protein [Candidatus Moranbacteria bacterium]